MVKTKSKAVKAKPALRESAPRSEVRIDDRPAVCCTHAGDVGHCWMCWLFKSLIVLFSAFLILWVGFYIGMLATRPSNVQLDPALGRLLSQKKFCAPQSGAMSHTMNTESMDYMMGNMTSALEDKTGAAFDKEFLVQMTVHHQGAVDMAKMALEKSERPELKTFAQSIINSQSVEITQMKTWLAEWLK